MKAVRSELASHRFFYVILFAVLLIGYFLRIYRIPELLAFHFDQGRDATVIWDLIKKGEVFLIGPTTGLAGIFRGPYYYYLIAPFYFLGRGDPSFPSYFLAFTTVFAITIGYFWAHKVSGRTTGLIFVIISSFSFYIIMASRWLSNPTPMMILSMILIVGFMRVIERKKYGWPIIATSFGLSLFNFGSSGELYYIFPILLLFVYTTARHHLGKKITFNIKSGIISIFLFVLTFAPLVIFDLKHQRILTNNFVSTFGQEKSFTLPTEFLFENRTKFYINLFPRIIFHSITSQERLLIMLLVVILIISLPKLIKNTNTFFLLLLIISPLLGLYFYQGNYTVLYEYYMTGYFLPFLLLISLVLGSAWRALPGKIFVILFIAIFIRNNYFPTKFILSDPSQGPESISFINQKQALHWIFNDSRDGEFNVDVYVPPVIPHSYNYLFMWLGESKYGKLPSDKLVTDLYTLYEVDPPHPERLVAWLERQKTIGKVIEEKKFGGITVQKRQRL